MDTQSPTTTRHPTTLPWTPTPAPWTLEPADEHRYRLVGVGGITIGYLYRDIPTNEANARLARTSPNLLLALETMERVFGPTAGEAGNESWNRREVEAVRMARSAIAMTRRRNA